MLINGSTAFSISHGRTNHGLVGDIGQWWLLKFTSSVLAAQWKDIIKQCSKFDTLVMSYVVEPPFSSSAGSETELSRFSLVSIHRCLLTPPLTHSSGEWVFADWLTLAGPWLWRHNGVRCSARGTRIATSPCLVLPLGQPWCFLVFVISDCNLLYMRTFWCKLRSQFVSLFASSFKLRAFII